jgi:two-component system, cell cycle response regulator
MSTDADETTRLGERVLATPPRGVRRKRPSVVVIAGENVGALFPIAHGAVIGRASHAAVRLLSDEVSRRHARIVETDGRWLVEDLGSRNGTWINGDRANRPAPLTDGDKIELGGGIVLRFALFDELDESYHLLMYESSLRDGLTRAFNRKYFDERLDQEFAYAVRHDSELALLMIDVDHFKTINDTYGHVAGDTVLTQLSAHLLRIIRAEDVFARYGGEEFAVLSRGIHHETGKAFGERVRSAVERYPFTQNDERIPVTVSVGVAAIPSPEVGQPSQLVEAADRALYRAKAAGRNRVEG